MVEKIENGVVVTMAYLMTVDGEEVENAPADDPMYYLHGAGTILPQLEAELTGKAIGDMVDIDIDMEPDIWEAPREDFENLPDDIGPGDEIDIYDADGEMIRAMVKEVNDDVIVMDLLDIEEWMIGKTANFKVQVLELRKATEEELTIGEPEEYFDFLMDDDEHDH
jgi:FKBP-type peptidyl-prolyl cis-trans isomerase SlyD